MLRDELVIRRVSRSIRRANRIGVIESLERRTLLAAAVATVTTRVAAPVLRLLTDITRLPTKTARSLDAAGADLYTPANTLARAANGATASVKASAAAAFTLDLAGIKQTLATAPLEFTKAAKSPLTFALPAPDGAFARFKVVEAPIVEPGLAKQLPGVKTFRGQGIDDPTAAIRLDYTPLGFHAQVLSPNGAYYVDPYYLNDVNGTYVSYFKRDAIKQGSFTCSAQEEAEEEDAPVRQLSLDASPYGSQLRTFRAAVAANRFYTNAVGGGTQAGGQAAVVTAMNRVDGVYESELAVRMVLVANNMNVIYTNTNGDPYSNDGNAIDQNTPNLNSVIGTANYDIGHVFTTGSGGVAYLGVVGNSSFKGGGTTGLSSPVGDAFYIDYVAHEMGHQFNANHTFNVSSTQRSASHAYEPGSGSSIMAYAGLFGANDIQPHSDPYFHSDSIDAIRAFLTSSIPSVGTTTATGNNAPSVPAQANYSIPTGTPFALTASGASDPDNDAITYDWQERELGPALALNGADNGTSPLNREIVPTASPTRYLPQLSSILSSVVNNQTNNSSGRPVERLPAVARTNSYSWRVLVRDNRSGGGGVASADVTLNVVNTGASFLVTSPNTAVSWTAGTTPNVTWNVAGTTGNGINVATVRILLSTDGGNTFPIVLADNVDNDGSQQITVPAINTNQARIKVEAIGNIFFDISNSNFQIVTPNGVWTGLGDGVHWSDPANWSNNFVPTSSTNVSINVAANPTIEVDGDQFAFSITSAEALNITGSLTVDAAATLNAPVTLSGGTIDGDGAYTFNNAMNWTGGSIAGAGQFTIASAGSFNVSGAAGTRTIDRPFTLNGPGSVAAGGDKLLRLNNTLTIGASGQLDLNDNDMLIDYSGTTPLPAVQGYLNAARNGGNWLGTTGITSSTAKNNAANNTTLGAIESSDYAFATFDGVAPPVESVLVKYTYYGDANFSGTVSFDDYVKIDTGFNTGLTGWANGDFNGSGAVNFDDYVLIDTTFNTQGAPL